MAASTASMCRIRLRDAVHSVTNSQASSRFMALLLSCFNDLAGVGDLGCVAQGSRHAAVFVAREFDGAVYGSRVNVLAGEDEMHRNSGVDLRVFVGTHAFDAHLKPGDVLLLFAKDAEH